LLLVGFTYCVGGLLDGSLRFAGEESARAPFLRHDGTVWTADKDAGDRELERRRPEVAAT